MKDVINRLKTFVEKDEGTYDFYSGKLVVLLNGFMVSFHQNEADAAGHYKSHYGNYTNEAYDRLSNDFVRQYKAEAYIGVYDTEPEISFKVDEFTKAVEAAKRYNQKCIWKNAEREGWDNPDYDVKKNPMRGD